MLAKHCFIHLNLTHEGFSVTNMPLLFAFSSAFSVCLPVSLCLSLSFYGYKLLGTAKLDDQYHLLPNANASMVKHGDLG